MNDIKRSTAIWLLILIIVLAAGLRIWVISRTILPAGDGAGTNMELAVNILQGRGWESDRKWTYYGPWGDWGPIPHPEDNQQPLTSILVAGAILIGGVDYHSGQSVALILSLASLLLLYLWASKRVNRKVALLACALGTISGSQIWFGANLDTQCTFQFTTLLFLLAALHWLPQPRQQRIKLPHAFILGILAGLTYLARANGLFILTGLWLWFLFWGGMSQKTQGNFLVRFLKHLLYIAPVLIASLIGFIIPVAPWLWRNWQDFGSPFYTKNASFVYINDFWAAWAVRSAPPPSFEWFQYHSLWELPLKEARGVFVALEPFILGNIHRQELYVEGPLVIFTLFALLWLLRQGNVRRDALPALLLLLHVIGLAAHYHTFRYMMPFFLLTFVYGTAGLRQVWRDMGESLHKKFKPRTIRWLGIVVALIAVAPMLRPLATTIRFDGRERGQEVLDAADFITRNTQPQDVIADFPVMETLIWKYRRPTILIPEDDLIAVQAVLESYKPVYLVVTPELLRLRKRVNDWLAVDDERRIVDKDIPANWERAWTSESGQVVVYKLNW